MKKFLFLLAMVASFSANAVELGMVATYNGTTDTVGQGITIGEKWDKVGAQVGLFNSVGNTGKFQHKVSATGSYDFYKLQDFTFNVKAGAAYIDKQDSVDGWTSVSGVGVNYPLTKSTKVTADYVRQQAFNGGTMSQFNSNIFQAGLKVSF